MRLVQFEKIHYYNRLIWLFPLVYFFHIIEESNGFYTWVTHVLKGEMSASVFYINNSVFMIILLALCSIVYKKRTQWSVFYLFLWSSGQIFWNFIFHIYTQVKFNSYSPGFFTAILLYFPVYLYLSYLAIRDEHLPFKLWFVTFIVGATGMWFVIWMGLYHFGKFPWEQWIP